MAPLPSWFFFSRFIYYFKNSRVKEGGCSIKFSLIYFIDFIINFS
jgi:hypothetical protein